MVHKLIKNSMRQEKSIKNFLTKEQFTTLLFLNMY